MEEVNLAITDIETGLPSHFSSHHPISATRGEGKCIPAEPMGKDNNPPSEFK